MHKNFTFLPVGSFALDTAVKGIMKDVSPLIRNLMKLSIIQVTVGLIFCGVAMARDNYAQELLQRKVSLSLREVALETALKKIELAAKVKFVYSPDRLNLNHTVTIDVNKKTLGDLLGMLLQPHDIDYAVQKNNDYIVLIQQQKQSENAVDSDLQSELVPLTADVAVSGKVSDTEGQPIPGVNIIEKGTTKGTTTDAQGKFTLSVTDRSAILVFSFIGYTTQEVAVGAQTELNITLAADVETLTEIVVVGYGTQKKLVATGAVASVKGTELVQSPTTNVSNTLAGRLPGVNVVTRSGEPGYDGSSITIRGLNTLNDNNPLIVVDGIQGRSLDRLDPNSIESITVLKDASAAIYGAQAANGVILITTKRGKAGKPEITVNFNQGYGTPTRLPEMLNSAEYATALNEIDVYRNRAPRYSADDIQKFTDGSDPWKYPNTNWFKEVLKPWSGQNYGNIQASGGSESLKYFLLLGTKSQDGFYKNSATKYVQHDFRSNIDGKLGENVSLSLDIAGRQENRKFPTRSAGDIFRMVMRGKPHMPAYWPDGTPGPDIEYGDNPVVVSTDATGYDKDVWYILNTNARLNVNIPWVKGLSFTGNAGFDKGFRFHKIWRTPWYLYSWDYQSYDDNGKPVLVKGKKGYSDARLYQETEDKTDVLLNAFFQYERTFSDHSLRFMAGVERRSGKGDRFNAYRRYYQSTVLDQLSVGGQLEKDNGGDAYHSGRLNYFGRINYDFSEKYLFQFVWRYDGSYIFPEDQRYGFFPGFSAGWRISEEDFWKSNVTFIDNFKLRGSWGQTGNDRIGEWQYLSAYRINSRSHIFDIDQENQALYESVIPNQNATWEIATQSNIGFEAQVLDGRLSLEADYFNNQRSKILIKRTASIPTSTGMTLPDENIGKVANRGFDFNVTYDDKVGNIGYTLSLNAGYAKNKILFWDEAPGAPEYQRTTGYPMGSAVDNNGTITRDQSLYYNAIGIFRDQAAVDAYPHWESARPGDIIFEDVNKDNVIDGKDRVRNHYNDVPRFTGGLNLGLQYKGFDLSILFQGAAGAVRYISTESGDIGNFLKDFYDNRWTAENPDASGPRTFNRDEEYWRNQRNTYFLHKTDYIRLKNVQLGYSLPSAFTEKANIKIIRFYVSGFNLATFSPDLKDFDPETNTASGQSYPLQKIINAGLSVTF